MVRLLPAKQLQVGSIPMGVFIVEGTQCGVNNCSPLLVNSDPCAIHTSSIVDRIHEVEGLGERSLSTSQSLLSIVNGLVAASRLQ